VTEIELQSSDAPYRKGGSTHAAARKCCRWKMFCSCLFSFRRQRKSLSWRRGGQGW